MFLGDRVFYTSCGIHFAHWSVDFYSGEVTMNNETKPQTVSKWLSVQETVRKRFAAGFSAVLICAVLSPVQENFRAKPRDSFPLSYFPMFTAKRDGQYQLNYIVGITAQGERLVIPYNYAGVGGFNQVRRQINRRVSKGKAEKLCQSVAKRLAKKVAQKKNHPLAGVVTVQILTGRYRFDDYFAGNKTPLSEKMRSSCAVPRRDAS
jgi:hypothetical protein